MGEWYLDKTCGLLRGKEGVSVGSVKTLLQVSEWKSIPFQSVYLRFIPIDYEWMQNLFPTHGLIRSESPITIDSFSVRIDVSSLFRMIPHQSETNSHPVRIRLRA